MSAKLEIDVDVNAFLRDAAGMVEGELKPAMARIANRLGELVVDRLEDETRRVFDRPTDFTQHAFGLREADASDTRDPAALVFAYPRQAGYLGLEIDGGVRQAGDQSTTRIGPLVPGRDAPRDEFGNLPRGFVRQALQQRDTAWVHLRPGEPPTLVRHRDGRTEILARIVSQAVYAPRLDVYGVAERAVIEGAAAAAAAEIKTVG